MASVLKVGQNIPVIVLCGQVTAPQNSCCRPPYEYPKVYSSLL